jgi:hypothetical protein
MTQKDGKRDYKHAYQLQLKNGEIESKLERQKARRMMDAAGVDRTGMHVDHKKKLKDGGKTTKSNIRLRSPKANVRDNGK